MLGTQTGPPQLQARSGTCGAVWPQTPSFAVQRAAALGGSPTVLEPLQRAAALGGSPTVLEPLQRAAALGGSPTVLEPLARPCFLAGSSVPSPSLGPDPSRWPSMRPSPLSLKEA